MTKEELYDTLGPWGEHPDHSVEHWQYEVGEDDTRLGYLDWVAAQLEMALEA